jgi:hypothetical protein
MFGYDITAKTLIAEKIEYADLFTNTVEMIQNLIDENN